MPSTYSYLIPGVGGLTTLIIGLIVLWHGRKNVQAKILALFVLVLSAWLFGTSYMFTHCGEPQLAVTIDRFIYLVVTAMPPVVFHFTTTMIPMRRARIYVWLGYGLMLLFWALTWSSSFLSGLYQYSNGCHSQAGWIHNVFLVYFVGFSFLILHIIYNAFRGERERERKRQLQFIFLALASQVIVGTTAFFSAYNINSIGVSYFSAILTTFFLIYAMFRHNLLDLRTFAMKTFTALAVAASAAQVFMAQETTLRMVNIVVFFMILGVGFLVTRNVQEEIENREKGERLARYLANANARLRTLDKQKTEFVSIASHQLRGPIAAIVGYASLAREGSYGKVPKKLSEPLSRIFESGKRISIMVDDFLNVTRIEQGRMSYNFKPSDVNAMVRKEVEELGVIGEQKGLKISYSTDIKEPVIVAADESKLSQVFQNLIDNAIKYTVEGSVSVHLRISIASGKALVTVSDTGIGIAADELQNLFQKFNRASNANTVSVYGAGLGLYIAREIVKAHDGWIHITSPGVGKGTTFTVELPLYDEERAQMRQ